jgi:TolB-like protein/class 3 adenylate cyclase
VNTAGPSTRRLAAILSIDMVAYSRQMRADEEGTLAALRLALDSVIHPAIATANGRVFKTTGDGLLCEFSSVVAAVSCAIAIQREFVGSGSVERPKFRIGVTLGDVVADGDDLFGDGVNLAARLQGAAEPGGIATSAVVRDQVGSRLPVRFVSRGKTTLKNIPEAVEIFDIVPGAAVARPSRRSRRLAAAVAASLLVLVVVGGAWWYLARPAMKGASAGVADSQTSAATAPLVAVLPFANQTGDTSQDFFSDGVTGDVIAALGRFRSLAVLSRSAMMSMKGATPEEAARRLGARYVVEGNARRAGDRVRVQASLTDAQDGQVLWSDRFENEAKDLLTMQDDLVQQIAGAIANKVGRVEQDRVIRSPPMNPTAHELVLRARALVNRDNRADLVEARGYLEQALAIMPDAVEARIGLARVFFVYVRMGYTANPSEALDDAEKLLREALRRDPSNAEGYALLARLLAARERYDEALDAIARALELNPSDAEAQFSRGTVLLWVGRMQEAIDAFEIGRRLDPFPSADTVFSISLANFLLGNIERARADLAASTAGTSRDRAPLYALLAIVYSRLGRDQEAKAAAENVRLQDPFFDGSRFGTRLSDPKQRELLADGLRKVGLRKD